MHYGIQDVGRAIHNAFSEIGFVFVTNHGVPSNTVRDLFASSKKFFELGQETKEGCPMTMMGGKACQVCYEQEGNVPINLWQLGYAMQMVVDNLTRSENTSIALG